MTASRIKIIEGRFEYLLLILILPYILFSNKADAQTTSDKEYLFYVKKFADTLLATAPDTYGQVHTGLWSSVIDTRDLSVPAPGKSVPPTPGTREHDRAVWGSNFYHDLATIKTFRALSAITGDPSYKRAVNEYAKNFLTYSQNPHTGLLGWGEHLYVHAYTDSVTVADGKSGRTLYHEFLAGTPPWELLWAADSLRTSKAIEGLIYHFRGPHTQTFLFNRHAYWKKISQGEYRGLEQFQDGGQPWIKHSGLLAYSFMFLYHETGDAQWLKWADGIGSLYWTYRNPGTNLTPSCLDDPRQGARRASLNGTSLLSYWLLKAWELNSKEEEFKKRAVIMLKAIAKYAWDTESNRYRGTFQPDGTLLDEEVYKIFTTGYGSSSLLQFGRIAVYFAEILQDPDFELMAYRVAGMLRNASLPNNFVINNLAEALNFSLDMYELSGDRSFLQQARRFADTGIEKLYRNGLLVRQPGDPYYEAKVGTGGYVQGLLRLHLHLHPDIMDPGLVDWSF